MGNISTVADMQALIDRSRFHQLFNPVVLEVNQEQLSLIVRMGLSASLERQPDTGQWHGGGIAAIVDIAGCYALALLDGLPLPTIDFRTDYLRPALNTDLIATGKVRKAGQRIGVVDVDIDDEQGRLIAVGRGSYSMQAFARN